MVAWVALNLKSGPSNPTDHRNVVLRFKKVFSKRKKKPLMPFPGLSKTELLGPE